MITKGQTILQSCARGHRFAGIKCPLCVALRAERYALEHRAMEAKPRKCLGCPRVFRPKDHQSSRVRYHNQACKERAQDRSTKARCKRYRVKRLSTGRCRQGGCQRPRAADRAYCAECMEQVSTHRKQVRARRALEGLCPSHGKPTVPGKWGCPRCMETGRRAARKRRKTRPPAL